MPKVIFAEKASTVKIAIQSDDIPTSVSNLDLLTHAESNSRFEGTSSAEMNVLLDVAVISGDQIEREENKESTSKSNDLSDTSSALKAPSHPRQNIETVSFPLKLIDVLSNKEHSDIISWLSHGRGFMIYKTKQFVTTVMPKYFKQTKFPSFTRKLSRWGFKRVQRGPEVGVYYHALFKRDNPRLCLQIRCLPKKMKRDGQELFSLFENQIGPNLTPYHSIPRNFHQNALGRDSLGGSDVQNEMLSEIDDKLLELLLLKKQRREERVHRSLPTTPVSDALIAATGNNYGAFLSNTTANNLNRRSHLSVPLIPSQCLQSRNFGDSIPVQTNSSDNHALQLALELCSNSDYNSSNNSRHNLLSSVLQDRGYNNGIASVIHPLHLQTLPSGLHTEHNSVMRRVLQNSNLAPYLL